MRRLLLAALLVVTTITSVATQGQVSVELLNMPTRIHSFEPVFVLYAIQNIGESPVLLPAESSPSRGPAVYFAREGTTPRWVGLVGDRAIPHARKTMWLAPGERWLRYQEISYWLGVLEGEMWVETVLSSSGRCSGPQVAGRHSYPLEPRRIDTWKVGVRSYPVYRCWEGEVRSNRWTLTVERPTSPIDRKAHDHLLQSDALLHDRGTDRWLLVRGYDLEELFPSSHYTYAVLARGNARLEMKQRAVELQPNHPLNAWVNGAIARELLEQEAERSGPTAEQVREIVDRFELPTGVDEYLEQHAWSLRHRRRAEAESSGPRPDPKRED